MAIQFKRGTTSNRTNYTPAAGELIVVDVDQVNPSIYVGDGSTAGGKLASAQGGGGVSEAFKTITISGQDNIVAEAEADTLTLSAGTNITLTTNATTDTITITNSYSAPAETDPKEPADVCHTGPADTANIAELERPALPSGFSTLTR